MAALSMPGDRIMNAGIFAACAAVMGTVLYMEHGLLLPPCGLCITQRVFVVLCGLVCLASAVHNPAARGRRAYALAAGAMCVFGGYFAGRQIWLQSLPEDEAPACGPGLAYLFENFPLVETIDFLLRGDGNCAEVQLRVLGLSIPQMSLLAFALLLALCAFLAFRRPPAPGPAAS